MLSKSWADLKSGSDVRGRAIETGSGIQLTDEVAERIARAFYMRLSEQTGKSRLRIAVGQDSRLSSGRLADAVARALRSSGGEVLLTGLSSTPAMFMTTKHPLAAADGAVMITASHLPYDKNGLKFFTPAGGLEGADILDILGRAERGERLAGPGSVRDMDFMKLYAAGLVGDLRRRTGEERPLSGKKIVVDAGNGAGGFYVSDVLVPLGADTAGSRFLEPDGNFPNHIPNPENPDAMRAASDMVRASGADFGIIFDTDVDRAGAVDAEGKEINRNRLIALISSVLLRENPGATIVTDSVTSSGLAAFLAAHGGVHRRFKRGYKNVIDEAIRLNAAGTDAPLAIETSGHAALRENYFLDDGAYLVTRLLAELARLAKEGKTLESLVRDLPEPAEAAEIRMGFRTPDFREYGLRVIEDLKAYAENRPDMALAPDNCEGVRISFPSGKGDGWLLLRMSLHDPIMPLNIESDVRGGTLLIARALEEFLSRYDGLDVTNLINYR